MRTLLLLIFAVATALPAQDKAPNPLFTAPPDDPLEGLRICVDPGHGGQIWGATRGYTGGTRSVVSSQTESEANLRVGLFLWDLLTQAGAEVVMTRTFETRLSEDCLEDSSSEAHRDNMVEELNIRVRVAEANECDLYVSIHHNAGGAPDTNYSTVYIFDPEQQSGEGDSDDVEHPADAVEMSKEVAGAIVERLGERLAIETIAPMHGNYHVLRENSLPAVLVECSFMVNQAQAERMEDLAYSRLAAIGIFEGILETCATENEEVE